MQKCRICEELKPLSEFYFRKDSGKYRTECKECYDKRTSDYYRNNKEDINEYQKNYRKENKEKIAENNKKYYINNKEKINKNKENNKEKIATYMRKYMPIYKKKNKSKILALRRKYQNNRRKRDPNFKIRQQYASRIRNALKGIAKSSKTLDLLGCSIEEYRIYLESLFQPGMSWDNYGISGWHVDHIIPCSSFNLSDPEEQKKCFNYKNTQPLWAKDNIKKSNTVDGK